MARYPNLVPPHLCKTPIDVYIDGEDLTPDGGPIQVVVKGLKCNYQDGGQTIINNEQEYVRISGNAYFSGDPFPQINHITQGKVEIFGEFRKIEQGRKHRNPDGTVNFTQIMIL